MDLYHGKEITEKAKNNKGAHGCLSREWFFHWRPCWDGRGIEGENSQLSRYANVQESF